MLRLRPIRQRLLVCTTATVLAVTAVPLVATTTLAAPTPLGINLIRNPGAEAGAGTNGYTTVAIPGWEAVGGFTVVRFGAPEFPTKAEATRFGGDNKFFSCGPNTEIGSLRQVLRITGRRSPIDAGRIRVRLRARQAGYALGPDEARIRLTFIDAADDTISFIRTHATFGTSGVFLSRIATKTLPAGTRSMLVTLHGRRGNDGGSYCDAYFDDISVILETFD